MKFFFFLFFISASLNVKSQLEDTVLNFKNSIHYKSNKISELIIQNYMEFNTNEKVAMDKVYGYNVDIYIDTIFFKYVFIYSIQNGEREIMIYNYIRNYYPSKEEKKWSHGVYLMEFKSVKFMLLNTILFNSIEVWFDKKMGDNYTHFFRIDDMRPF